MKNRNNNLDQVLAASMDEILNDKNYQKLFSKPNLKVAQDLSAESDLSGEEVEKTEALAQVMDKEEAMKKVEQASRLLLEAADDLELLGEGQLSGDIMMAHDKLLDLMMAPEVVESELEVTEDGASEDSETEF